MNRAHRIADQFRNVVGWLGRVPTESQFVQKGFLTPAEFVEAGDQLVYQCPSWQWQSCPTKKNQVFWLPPNKQYLLTRNIPCRHRVGDWDSTLYRQSRVTSEGWLVPGPQPAATEQKELAKQIGSEGTTQCTVQIADGREIEVRHQQESCSSSELDDDDEEEEDGERASAEQGDEVDTLQTSAKATDRNASVTHHEKFDVSRPMELSLDGSPNDDFVEIDSTEKATSTGPMHSRLSGMITRTASQIPGCAKLLPGQSLVATPVIPSVMEDDFCLVGTGKSEEQVANKSAPARSMGSKRGRKKTTIPTRSYDLSITYDKYYQSPRLWLFGYDESGVPLRADAVFEDIHTDYLSKTVTVDPHPFTGVPTVSVHPCKHAAVMKTVAQNWLRSGIQPRHDLALFVLLKMVSSVVPTINYDFTIDIEMPLGRQPSDSGDADEDVSDGQAKTSQVREDEISIED